MVRAPSWPKSPSLFCFVQTIVYFIDYALSLVAFAPIANAWARHPPIRSRLPPRFCATVRPKCHCFTCEVLPELTSRLFELPFPLCASLQVSAVAQSHCLDLATSCDKPSLATQTRGNELGHVPTKSLLNLTVSTILHVVSISPLSCQFPPLCR